MSDRFLVTFCGLLLAMGAFSCDILLPAFWSLSQDLSAPLGLVQAVIPVFIMASAIGQLLFGAASDRYGRRPVLIVGLLCYLVGTLIGLMATSIAVVLLCRVLQGLGGACAVVVGRAILRDCHGGPGLAQAMALAMAIFAFGPIVAPLLGYGLVAQGGWRLVFAGMAVFGAALVAGAIAMLKETNEEINPQALRANYLGQSILRLLTHPQSRFFIFLASINAFGITSFIANAPLLFQNAFGIEGLMFAVIFALTGLGIVVGQIANRRLIGRVGVLGTTRLAAGILAAVSASILGLHLAGFLSVWSFGLLMFVFDTSFLVVMANSASLIIDPHKDIAGLASSIFGFVSQFVASALTLLTLPLFKGDMGRWSLSMLIVTTTIYLAALGYRQARGRRQHAA
ncbi:MAG: multidrug effflux MFS transporter [Hyphomicrobiaceae bacterium]|nr:MAG: multidrug effflux MFS transporter [Hyphomicrobiaceae bacterium]